MRTIDADALWDEVRELADYAKEQKLPSVYNGLSMALGALNQSPTIEAEPVRHARLLVTNGWFYCGFCNSVLLRKAFCEDVLQPPRYCMWCGAKFIDEVSE